MQVLEINMDNCKIYEKYESDFNSRKGPLVSIVTTAYNNIRFNEKYFETVNNQTYKNIETIFVDNLSPDDTVQDALNRLKNGKVVASLVNTGCAGGNNLGAWVSKGKYIFLLGPDTWSDPECVAMLVHAAEKNDNNIYTSRQMTYDGKGFISCGVSADIFGYPARAYTNDGKKQIRKVFYADGTSVFMKLVNYKKLGMMDESTFLFAEDVDLSWKARIAGMDIVPVPESVLYHFSGGAIGIGGYPSGEKYETNRKRRFMAERNIIRNNIKNHSLVNIMWVIPFYLLINFAESVSLLFTGQFKSIFPTYFKAYWWNLANLKNTIEKRRQINKIRVTSDNGVMKVMNVVPSKLYALLELGVPKVS